MESNDKPASTPQFLWPQEPKGRLSARDINDFLLYCSAMEASDITVATGRPATFKRHGTIHQATKRPLDGGETNEALTVLFKSDSGAVQVNGMASLDFAYEIHRGRDAPLRFRVNVGAVNVRGSSGLHLTLRVLNGLPPRAQDLGVEPELLSLLEQASKLSVVCGSTGSGKSTLLASVLRHMLEKPWANTKILTVEDPIEYNLDELSTPTAYALQCEIGRQTPGYHEAVHRSLRQDGSAFLVGETRDDATLDACVWAATSGKPVFTTLHADSAPLALRRMVAMHPQQAQESKSVEIIEALSVVASQKLVPSLDGRRVALREYLPLDFAARDALMGLPASRMVSAAQKILVSTGQTFLAAAERAYKADKTISESVFLREVELAKQRGLG